MQVEPGNYLLQVSPGGQSALQRLPDRFSIRTPDQGGDTVSIGRGAKAGAKVSGLVGLLGIVATGLQYGFKNINPAMAVGGFIGSMISGALFGGAVGYFLKKGQH